MLFANAEDAFSNLEAAPNVYLNNTQGGTAKVIDADSAWGYQFTATANGQLSGFSVAMNDYELSGPQQFAFSLYKDDGANHLGTLLGAYSGTSTGVNVYDGRTSPLAEVPATGTPVWINLGTKY